MPLSCGQEVRTGAADGAGHGASLVVESLVAENDGGQNSAAGNLVEMNVAGENAAVRARPARAFAAVLVPADAFVLALLLGAPLPDVAVFPAAFAASVGGAVLFAVAAVLPVHWPVVDVLPPPSLRALYVHGILGRGLASSYPDSGLQRGVSVMPVSSKNKLFNVVGGIASKSAKKRRI